MKPKFIYFVIFLIVFVLISFGVFLYLSNHKQKDLSSQKEEESIYVSFLFEVYNKILGNYWNKVGEEDLGKIYKLGIDKLNSKEASFSADIKSEPGVSKGKLKELLIQELDQKQSNDEKEEFTKKLANLVLVNLPPFGRSRLYGKKEEEVLKNRIKNINPEIDRYKDLGVDKNATPDEMEEVYQKKVAGYNALREKTDKEEEEFESLKTAYKILSDQESKETYDKSGVEPTIDYALLRPKIFYIHIKKFSPTSYADLKRVVGKVEDYDDVDSLIIDLQDNIGGTIDTLAFMLGPFIGHNQYAYQFYHQGETTDFKTKTGWLSGLYRYKKVVILINGETQSSGELMAATLKKYNVGVLVGTPTKGWGTIEKVFSLESQFNAEEKYSMFLVHSLTLRDDGKPVQRNGVEPVVNIKNPGWEKELFAFFHYDELVEATKEVLRN